MNRSVRTVAAQLSSVWVIALVGCVLAQAYTVALVLLVIGIWANLVALTIFLMIRINHWEDAVRAPEYMGAGRGTVWGIAAALIGLLSWAAVILIMAILS